MLNKQTAQWSEVKTAKNVIRYRVQGNRAQAFYLVNGIAKAIVELFVCEVPTNAKRITGI